MAGIYIHIPFCRQACLYCNFHFATSLRNKDALVSAILKETDLQRDYLSGALIETIYIGGGTPSLLPANDIRLLTERVRHLFQTAPGAELTLEANPDDITPEKLTAWKAAGINRLSIGIQSFFDEDLRWMNRAHTAQMARESLSLALRYFDNITIDLIYGSPRLSQAQWKQNVETAIASGVQHISCYALTVEPRTPLDKMIRQGKMEEVNPDQQSDQFLLLMQWMEEAGYEHYEISNFAKPGHRSRHNSAYWQGVPYLGLGPSAHSYNGTERQWNLSNNTVYIKSVEAGQGWFEKELLTQTQQLNEYIMIALRTREGISLSVLREMFGIDEQEFLSKARPFAERGLLILGEKSIYLTNEGKLLADGIAAELFFSPS